MSKSILKTNISYNEDTNSKTEIKFDSNICVENKLANNNFLYSCDVRKGFSKQLFTISFTCNTGFYYSEIPKIYLNTKFRKNYTINSSVIKGGNSQVISKIFIISYKNNGNSTSVDGITFSYSTEKSNTKIVNLGIRTNTLTTLYNKVATVAINEIQALQTQIEQLESQIHQDIKAEVVVQEAKSLTEFYGSIKNIDFAVDNIASRGGARNFGISGIPGTIFSLIIGRDNDNYTYDPLSRTFKVGNYRFNNIKIPISGTYEDTVLFPSVSSDKTYKVTILVLNGSNDSGVQFPISISQYSEITITFAIASGANSSSYNTMPSSVTLTRPANYEPTSATDNYLAISWGVSLKSANDSSLTVIKQPDISDFFTTKNINTDDPEDAHAGTNTIKLDDVIGLSDGLTVTGSSPFDVSEGTQYITDVNVYNNQIEVTSTQDLNDNQAITFTGFGKSGIQALSALTQTSSGTVINFQDMTCELTETTTTTDAVSTTDATLNLTSTKGIKAAVTGTVDGATEELDKAVLDSVANLAVGMTITATDAGSISDAFPTITSIDVANKVIYLSTRETLDNNATLTFNASKVTGPGVSGDIWVSTVSAGASVEATAAQTLENGVTLSFGTASSKTATITVTLAVTKLSDKSFTATLELDNFLNVH